MTKGGSGAPRAARALAMVAAVVMVAGVAVAVAAPAAPVQRLADQVRGAGSLLEVGGNPTRGAVVMCQRQYDGEEAYVATAVDLFHWRDGGKTPAEKRAMQAEYVNCFTGGRQAHRNGPLMLEPHQTRSLDWGVELDVEKNWTSNFIHVTNTRDEPIVVEIDGNSSSVVVEPALPAKFRLAPRSTKHVVTATRFPGAEKAAFVFGWRAEPARYLQSPQTIQVSSKGITVIARHYPRKSVLTAYNSRADPEPVKLAVDFKAMYGTDRRNIVVRDGDGKWVRDSAMTRLEPGSSKVLMVIRARKIGQPWYFGWSYKWEAGDSPLEVFGLGDV